MRFWIPFAIVFWLSYVGFLFSMTRWIARKDRQYEEMYRKRFMERSVDRSKIHS